MGLVRDWEAEIDAAKEYIIEMDQTIASLRAELEEALAEIGEWCNRPIVGELKAAQAAIRDAAGNMAREARRGWTSRHGSAIDAASEARERMA